MSESPYVFEVTQHNFARSWWRIPSERRYWWTLGRLVPTLQDAHADSDQTGSGIPGGFILAKINADAEQALAGHFRSAARRR